MAEKKLEQAITELAEPRLAEQGLELVDLELGWQAGRRWVRLFIDRVNRDQGGVTVAECGEFNTLISRLLEVEELITESWLLEVSSPGLNRRLRKVKDFQARLGEKVTVVVKAAQDGHKRFRGRLAAADESGVTVETGVGPGGSDAREPGPGQPGISSSRRNKMRKISDFGFWILDFLAVLELGSSIRNRRSK